MTINRTADNWVPACGGTEVPMTSRAGRRILYCWQPSTGDHRYIDLGSDMALPVNFDPMLDGTALDPTLPPKSAWVHFLPFPDDGKVTVLLIEEQRDLSCLAWSTILRLDVTSQSYPVPTGLINGTPAHHATRHSYGTCNDHLQIEVADQKQALDILSVALRALTEPVVSTELDGRHRDVAMHLCRDLGGDPGNIWVKMNLMQGNPGAPAYNW